MDKYQVDVISVTAKLDQFAEIMANVAGVVARYNRELRQRGFLAEEAFVLSRDFQADYLDHLFSRMREVAGDA